VAANAFFKSAARDVAEATRLALRSAVFSKASARKTLVYQLVDDSETAMYYGISKDYRLIGRLGEHAKESGRYALGGSFRGMQVISEPLYETEAENLERWLIQNNPGVVNLARYGLRMPVAPMFAPTSTVQPVLTLLNPHLHLR
jgi:hypothetical protein